MPPVDEGDVCAAPLTRSFKLSYFQGFQKALDRSFKVDFMMNDNQLLYAQCSYHADDKAADTEIAFYIAALKT